MNLSAAELNAQLDDLHAKVERLVLRHAEIKRANALFEQRVQQLEAERDSLRTRLGEARSRVDQLLDRLGPSLADGTATTPPPAGTTSEDTPR